jgi:hypothetical protein
MAVSTAAAQTWTTGTPAPHGLGYHTATLLQDGRVLFVTVWGPPLLFDPRSGAWTETVSPPAGLTIAQPTAALLRDGRVLVAGGRISGGSVQAAAYLFDPRTNAWTAAASMLQVRVVPASVLLPDGRLLVTGGSNDIPNPLQSSEIYDPASDTWSPAANMSVARAGHAMVPLLDGRVLICGLGAGDLYDPATNTMTQTGPPLMSYRRSVAALLLPNGKVMAAGNNQSPGSATVELYDPATNSWSLTGGLVDPVTAVSLSLLPDGRVLLTGEPLSGTSSSAQIYDPATELWTPAPPTTVEHLQHSATVLPDGRVLVIGALGNPPNEIPEIFDNRTTSSLSVSPMSIDRASPAAAVLGDGRVLVVGGLSISGGALADGAVYEPGSDTWQATPSMSTTRRMGHAAQMLRDGRVLVFGGVGDTTLPAATDIYDPASNTWQAGRPLNVPRFEFATAMLSNGWVLAISGLADSTTGALTPSVEMYIPEVDRWVPMAPMPDGAARRRLTAVRLADDRVLVAGGTDTPNGNATTNAWIFDYRTNAWTAINPLPVGREAPLSALLPDGRVIIVGQYEPGGVVSTTTDIWNPATGLWTSVPLAGPARFAYALVTLSTGEVATVGGYHSDPLGYGNEIAVFDPTTSTWAMAGTLATYRHTLAAVVLPDGRIASIGGIGLGRFPLAGVELTTLTRGSQSARQPLLLPLAALVNSSSVTLSGVGFSGPYTAAGSGYATSSATNYPLVRYRSLTTNDQGTFFGEGWDDTSVRFPLPGGHSLGAMAVTVHTNGIASAPQLTVMTSMPSSTTALPGAAVMYSSLAQAVTLGSFVTLSGADGGRVLFYVTDSGGAFVGSAVMSSPFSGGSGGTSVSYTLPAGTPTGVYTVVAVYTGGAWNAPSAGLGTLQVLASPTTMMVTPDVSTVVRGGRVRVTGTVATLPADPGVNGTITLGNGVESCSAAAAPSGACDLTFTQMGPITITGAYAPAPSTGYLPSTANASITVTCPIITLTPSVLPTASVDQPYAVRFEASGGLAPYTYSTSGALPPGLTFSGDTLSGTPTSNASATFTVRATEAGGACGGSQVYTLSTGVREYTLAEGATNSFFRSDISIANPNASNTPITLTYVSETGGTATEARTLTPFSRLTIPTGAGSVAATVGSTFATRVTSDASLPLVVERATYFDGTSHAGDLSTASEGGSTTWSFAEGANGYFHTYLTLGNLGDQTADVTVRYMPEASAPFDRQYSVAPHSRRTIDTRTEAALAADAFAMTVTSTVPIAADRVQYFGSPFIGAHADGGARDLSADWYFAEGASGSAFDTYLLLGNPSSTDANVTVTYHTDGLDTVTKTYTVRGEGRRSISVEVEDPKLATGSFWMEVHSDRPIVAERAMYLIRAGAWTDATDTTGATAPALRWGLAEGVGGPPLGYVPYLLIANPGSAQAASITVQYLLPAGPPLTHTYTVPAQGRLTLDIRAEQPTLTGQQFGIIVSSTNNTPIIVERSLYWTLGTTGFVGAMNSMGTPLPPLP